jgi:hypothetical protein
MTSVRGGANGDQDPRIVGSAGISLDRGEFGKLR